MSKENLIMQKNIKLNMSRRIRRTPFTNKVEECGVSDFTVVNHMLLPKGFKNTIEEDYWHLKEQVQVWDVSCQRQVQITGPDAEKLVQKMTPRSIKKMETGKCFYIPIIDDTAGMINDPVLLKLDDDMFGFLLQILIFYFGQKELLWIKIKCRNYRTRCISTSYSRSEI